MTQLYFNLIPTRFEIKCQIEINFSSFNKLLDIDSEMKPVMILDSL